MSKEENETYSSPEEGFSASEDEWKPCKDSRGGESSDDDDSDFEGLPNSAAPPGATSKKRELKGRSVIKQNAVKKRKSSAQSLRSRMYNKYKPPPKTLVVRGASNSPSASTSKISDAASKNAVTPNDGSNIDNDNESSDSSGDDYLVNPVELDLNSSFFDGGVKGIVAAAATPSPHFDCNAGMNLSDSGSEDNNDTSECEAQPTQSKAFDFRNLLEKANDLERAKEAIAKRANSAGSAHKQESQKANSVKNRPGIKNVETLLALGENQANQQKTSDTKSERQKSRQTKATRQKRSTKTKTTGNDTEDSDWEEVADVQIGNQDSIQTENETRAENLEIHVEWPDRQRSKKTRKQEDLDAILKRKLNREIKERQLLLHKATLLCCFARSYLYNRLLNETDLMQEALKLLPSTNSYPPERGTELKYYQSLVKWFKTVIKLKSEQFYPLKIRKKCDTEKLKKGLFNQLKKKEANCKQNMVFIFVTLVRGMGLQCRLVVNMQPLPLRPAQSELCKITMKKPNEGADEGVTKKSIQKNPEKLKKANTRVEGNKASIKGTEKSLKPERKNKEKSENTKVKKSIQGTSNEKPKKVALRENTKNTGEASGGNNTKRSKTDGTKNEETNVTETISENQQKTSSWRNGKLAKNIPNQNFNEQNVEEKGTDVNTKGLQSGKRSSSQSVDEIEGSDSNPKSQFNDPKKQKILSDKREEQTIKGTENVAQKYTSKETEEEKGLKKPALYKLKRNNAQAGSSTTQAKGKMKKLEVCEIPQSTPIARRTRLASSEKEREIQEREAKMQKPVIEIGSPVIPKIVLAPDNDSKKLANAESQMKLATDQKISKPIKRSLSKSPKVCVSPEFLQTKSFKEKFNNEDKLLNVNKTGKRKKSKSPSNDRIRISPELFLTKTPSPEPLPEARALRPRLRKNIPQLDGADDISVGKGKRTRKLNLHLLRKPRNQSSDDPDFEISPAKQKIPTAPVFPKPKEPLPKDRRVLSSDDEADSSQKKGESKAVDMWVEVWSDVEDQWICIDLDKGKLNSVDTIRKSASSNLAYVYAFQNDLSLKDITARYCPHWSTMIRKSRVDKTWLDGAISGYLGQRTKRDLCEDMELRRIQEEKPMPTSIAEYKDHPLYVLERHLLKFQAIYPPDPPTLGFVRGEPVYSRDCVHTLHSRDIWLKQARTVKLGEKPYKIVKARPKWDKFTQSIITGQPLEVFGHWQTEPYKPPVAENGLVPRNAYGNVDLFKACMLPKKTVHIRLPGLNRICKKLGIDCANAVSGFDFHQGSCHPMYDGFVVCEEFADQVVAAWHQDQEDQERKEQEKYESRVYGNWKKLIRGLLIRERLKKKYNF